MKKYLLPLLFSIVLVGCTVNELEILPENPDENTTRAGVPSSEATNPYSLSKVQAAYNLVAAEKGWSAKEFEATDLYVRFLAADSLDYYILDDSLNLELFDYPLDRKLTSTQKDEFAADYSAGGIWQYTTVPPDFDFPTEMVHEVIDEVYMPRSSATIRNPAVDLTLMQGESSIDAVSQISPGINEEQWMLIMGKSMEITGNVSESGPAPSSGDGWHPEATIMYQTDYVNNAGNTPPAVPLEGVKVRVSNGMFWDTVYTDKNGRTGPIHKNAPLVWWDDHYNEVDYTIIWDNPKWNIRNGRIGQAKTKELKDVREPYVTTFEISDEDGMFATCHKALYNYFYKSEKLQKTKGLTIFNTTQPQGKLDVGMIHDDYNTKKSGIFLDPFPFGGTFWTNEIVVWGEYEGGDKFPLHLLESHMYHELGHASHFERNSALEMLEGNIRESWANTVEYAFMSSSQLYPDYQGDYNSSPIYTGIGEWLMRNGITMNQIEEIVYDLGVHFGPTEWDEWCSRTKELNIIDDEIVDILFGDPWTEW